MSAVGRMNGLEYNSINETTCTSNNSIVTIIIDTAPVGQSQSGDIHTLGMPGVW